MKHQHRETKKYGAPRNGFHITAGHIVLQVSGLENHAFAQVLV